MSGSTKPPVGIKVFIIITVVVVFILGGRYLSGGPARIQTATLALLDAAGRGDLADITRQIEAGAKVDGITPSAGNETEVSPPLLAAAGAGKAEAVSMLLRHGAKADVRSGTKETALMLAARSGNAPTLRALIDAGGIGVDETDADGRTALMHAAAAGWGEGVRMLVAAGAAVNAKDVVGRTPLSHAVSQANGIEAATVLIAAWCDVNLADAQGVTPLMHASDSGDTASVFALLNAGADAKVVDQQGRLASDWASSREGTDADLIRTALAQAQ